MKEKENDKKRNQHVYLRVPTHRKVYVIVPSEFRFAKKGDLKVTWSLSSLDMYLVITAQGMDAVFTSLNPNNQMFSSLNFVPMMELWKKERSRAQLTYQFAHIINLYRSITDISVLVYTFSDMR